jgi:hypothetical protein
MKKLGDILSVFFDEDTLEKARGYGYLFSSWGYLTTKCGIPQAAAHSRITGLEKSLLLVEADHPGWIQILQTKQKELLEEMQKRFPGFFITGIVLRLSRPVQDIASSLEPSSVPLSKESARGDSADYKPSQADGKPAHTDEVTWIGDERLRTALEKLKKSIEKKP